jgi:hypothetical protein
VIPHFENHPLRAKKARDFIIWKDGIELLYRISRRPLQRGFGSPGFRLRLTEKDESTFLALVNDLKTQRQFR